MAYVKMVDLKCEPKEIPGFKGDKFNVIVLCEYHGTEPAYVAARLSLNGADLGIVETDDKVGPSTAVKFVVTVVLGEDYKPGTYSVECQVGYRFDKAAEITWTDGMLTTIKMTGRRVEKAKLVIPDYVKYGVPIIAAGTIIPYASTRNAVAAVAGLAASTAVYHYIIWPRIKKELEAKK